MTWDPGYGPKRRNLNVMSPRCPPGGVPLTLTYESTKTNAVRRTGARLRPETPPNTYSATCTTRALSVPGAALELTIPPCPPFAVESHDALGSNVNSESRPVTVVPDWFPS